MTAPGAPGLDSGIPQFLAADGDPNNPESIAAAFSASTALVEGLPGRLRRAVSGGIPWYPALLAIIHDWTLPQEEHEGRTYQYLVAGEAFDWLLLAERLCGEILDLVEPEELRQLLFFDRPPVELSPDEFRESIGPAKYRAYLNYLYGITLEEYLMLAIELEMQKEQRSGAWHADPRDYEDAHQRLYGKPLSDLLGRFQAASGLGAGDCLSVADWKAFTYWLFKYRVSKHDKARVASDMRKAMREMERQRSQRAESLALRAARTAQAQQAQILIIEGEARVWDERGQGPGARGQE